MPEDGHSLLEDVWVTLYGKAGDRLDNLRTRSCDYMVATGDISCAGKVQIDLQSAEDARRHPADASHSNATARIIHVDTSGIVFNQKTGLAATDQPVVFRFPARRRPRSRAFATIRNRGKCNFCTMSVWSFIHRSSPGRPQPPEGTAADCNGYWQQTDLSSKRTAPSPVWPCPGSARRPQPIGGKLDLEFDEQLWPQRLVATGKPVLRETVLEARAQSQQTKSQRFLRTLDGLRVRSPREMSTHRQERDERDHLDADTEPTRIRRSQQSSSALTATGKVHVRSVVLPEGGSRNLQTSDARHGFLKSWAGRRCID